MELWLANQVDVTRWSAGLPAGHVRRLGDQAHKPRLMATVSVTCQFYAVEEFARMDFGPDSVAEAGRRVTVNEQQRIERDGAWIRAHGHQLVHMAQKGYQDRGRGFVFLEPYVTDQESVAASLSRHPAPVRGGAARPVPGHVQGHARRPRRGWPGLEADVATYDPEEQCILVLADMHTGVQRYRLSLRPIRRC